MAIRGGSIADFYSLTSGRLFLRTGIKGSIPGGVLGFLLGLVAGIFTVPVAYGVGLFLFPIIGILVGIVLGFHFWAFFGLFLRGWRLGLAIVPVSFLVCVGIPYGAYETYELVSDQRSELIEKEMDADKAPFLEAVESSAFSRFVIRQYLDQFFICAGWSSDSRVLDALIAIDNQNKEGFALCGVAAYGSIHSIERLLAAGFKPTESHSPEGEICNPMFDMFSYSSSSGPCRKSMYGSFDEFSARPSRNGCLKRAAISDLLIRAGNPLMDESYGRNAMTAAARSPCLPEILTVLKKSRLNVDQKDRLGMTGLMVATIEKDPRAVESFLRAGANPHLKDSQGRKAIDMLLSDRDATAANDSEQAILAALRRAEQR